MSTRPVVNIGDRVATLARTVLLCAAVAACAGSDGAAGAPEAGGLPTIPVETLTLDNGLEVILSQDDSLPIVAVNLWYPRVPDGLAWLAEALTTDPADVEARATQLGGAPAGLGELGADRSRLERAIESMLIRPELAFTPEPPGREQLDELIASAW